MISLPLLVFPAVSSYSVLGVSASSTLCPGTGYFLVNFDQGRQDIRHSFCCIRVGECDVLSLIFGYSG